MSDELFARTIESETAEEIIINNNTKKYLTFISDKLIFGVDVSFVEEIITNHSITVIPTVPKYIKGIINLRGQIIPIIDLRLKLGKAPYTLGTHNCIIVLHVQEIFVGILIDSILQVIDIETDKVSQMPADTSQKLVSGMISLPNDEVMLVFDCEQLVSK